MTMTSPSPLSTPSWAYPDQSRERGQPATRSSCRSTRRWLMKAQISYMLRVCKWEQSRWLSNMPSYFHRSRGEYTKLPIQRIFFMGGMQQSVSKDLLERSRAAQASNSQSTGSRSCLQAMNLSIRARLEIQTYLDNSSLQESFQRPSISLVRMAMYLGSAQIKERVSIQRWLAVQSRARQWSGRCLLNGHGPSRWSLRLILIL